MDSARRRRGSRATSAGPRAISGRTNCRSSTPAFERAETNFPVQYIGANVPQAWAAGAAFMLTGTLLGILPDAPRNILYIDPWLPQWLPDLTVHDLHLGRHKLDIRFWREGEDTLFEVTKGNPRLVERCDLAAKFAALRTRSDPL